MFHMANKMFQRTKTQKPVRVRHPPRALEVQPREKDLQHVLFGNVDREVAPEEVLQMRGRQPLELGLARERREVLRHEVVHASSQPLQGVRLRDGHYVHAIVQIKLRLKRHLRNQNDCNNVVVNFAEYCLKIICAGFDNSWDLQMRGRSEHVLDVRQADFLKERRA